MPPGSGPNSPSEQFSLSSRKKGTKPCPSPLPNQFMSTLTSEAPQALPRGRDLETSRGQKPYRSHTTTGTVPLRSNQGRGLPRRGRSPCVHPPRRESLLLPSQLSVYPESAKTPRGEGQPSGLPNLTWRLQCFRNPSVFSATRVTGLSVMHQARTLYLLPGSARSRVGVGRSRAPTGRSRTSIALSRLGTARSRATQSAS